MKSRFSRSFTSLSVLLFGLGSLMAQEHLLLGPKDGRDLAPTDLNRVGVGSPAPDFTLESKDGAKVTLSDFRGGKKVVLVFYRGHW